MSFPEQPFGFVAGRWVLSIGDTPDDADRAPDYVPVKDGAVVFTPQVTHRVAADGSGWAGIIKDRVFGRVGERGQLIDAEGHDHLALAVGVYSVSYDFGLDKSWPSHYIEVKPEHTVGNPLWLPPIAPPPEGPMIENRVVTIPADGEDGQVLVWDGAGFSWMDVPEGPQGPPGEVTTAALTTALAGKVTGQGMTVRVDNSVGERVFLDRAGYPPVMLHGDTGWRDVTPPLPDRKLISGQILLRRVNSTLMVWLKDIVCDELSGPQTVTAFNSVFGMVPPAVRTTFDVGDIDLVDTDEFIVYGSVTMFVRWMARKTQTGRINSIPAFTRPRSGVSFLNIHGETWPTALPGTPA